MKKLFLFATIGLSSLFVSAQNYEAIKNQLIFTDKFQQAKTDLDKAMNNAKFAGKAEAYILKAAVYAGLAMSDQYKDNPAGEQLLSDAAAAFLKYKEMDPTMALITDPIYQNGPVNIYSAYYSRGYNDYAAANDIDRKKSRAKGEELEKLTKDAKAAYQMGYDKLKVAVQFSDLLIEKKVLNMPLDTNVLILAGVTAENSGNKDAAALYYGRMADNKLAGDGFESIYRFLVSYSFEKKDMAGFEKYKSLGAQLYPKSDYFTFDKIDFAVGLMTDFNDKIKALDEVLATDPTNYKANEIMGELIYDTLNSNVEGAVMPANAAELEGKMVVAFNRSAEAKPGQEAPFIYIGDHFINKAAKLGDAKEALRKEMAAKAKPGVKPSPEDVAKKDQLEKQYGEALEGAREPYEKAAALLGEKLKNHTDPTHVNRDKQQYKKVASYLSDIYAYKKTMAKGKPQDMAKYETEEKKWSAVYESIK